MDLQNLDRALLKSVRVEDPKTGVKTPRVLMSRELGGEFQKGDVLDANATAILIEEISGSGTHGDVKKYCDEQIALIRADMGVANGFATLDAKGNVPLTLLGNVDTELYVIVSSLPATGKANKIYLVKDATSEIDDNKYYEWAYIDSKWEKVGEIHEDITGYLKKTQSADDVNKGAILNGGTLAAPIASGVTYKTPLFTGTLADNTPLLSIADNYTHNEGKSLFLTSGSVYANNGYFLAGGMAFLNSIKLKLSNGTYLDQYALHFNNGVGRITFGYEKGYLSIYDDTYGGLCFNNNNTHSDAFVFSAPNGVNIDIKGLRLYNSNNYTEDVYLSFKEKLLALYPFYYTNNGIKVDDYYTKYYNGNKFLGLSKYVKDTTSGTDVTIYEIGPTISATATDYTKYTNAAPLVQDTEDETKWYVPTEYLKGVQDVQIDTESIVDADTKIANIDYLKKGDQILIKADTDTVHAIVTSGKVDLGDSNTVGTSKQAAIGFNNTLNTSVTRSYVFGHENTSSSGDTVVIGGSNTNNNTTAEHGNNVILGFSNNNQGTNSFEIGSRNTSSSVASIDNYIFGLNNTLNASSSCVIGGDNTVTEAGQIVVGYSNKVNGDDAYMYRYCNVFGHSNTLNNDIFTSTAIGNGITLDASYSNALGLSLSCDNTSKNSMLFGQNLHIYHSESSMLLGIKNFINDEAKTSYKNDYCFAFGWQNQFFDDYATANYQGARSVSVGITNHMYSGELSSIYGYNNNIYRANTCNAIGSTNTIGSKDSTILLSNAFGNGNAVTANRATAFGFWLQVVNEYETALGHYNNSTSGSTIFSVGNGYYDSTSKTTSRHNLIEANRDGDLYIVEKTNTDGDTTNFYERPMKRLQTWLNEKVDVANIGADDDTTAYTHVCPIVQDTVDTSKWTIPSRYLDATIQDAAFKSEANTFSKTNTFTDGTNSTVINGTGVSNSAKTSKDLFNAAAGYAHIGTSTDTADYTDVAPIKETSETYTPAGGTETTETNTIVPMDYMPKQLHVEDKVDEKSTQVVSSKAIYEAIPHVYIHDVVISHGSNTSFYSYLQIFTLDDYDFSTVANIAKWMNSNGYINAATGHPCTGRTATTSNNMFCWYSANGTTLTLLYTTGSNMSAYNCDSQIKVSVRKRKLFNE